jgi:16S rRNA processing protein RimM
LNLEDVDTIEKAAMLVKKDIYLPNKVKPKKKKEEFTLKDVKGFIAVDVLFPLNESIIQGIDRVKNIVTVDLPEGLLDIYME